MGYLMVGLVLAYVLGGMHLTAITGRYYRDPARLRWATDLLKPSLFTEEGNRLRRRVLLYYLAGGAALLLIGALG
jgi:hypothetical protein